jgi:hypothetical protein
MAGDFKRIYLCGSMRSGTTIHHRLVCQSPDVNPFGPGARYLMEQMKLYGQFAGPDSIWLTDYFGDVPGFTTFTRDLVDRIATEAWSRAGKPAGLVLKSPEMSFYVADAAPILGDTARFVFSVRDPRDTIASMIKAGERQRAGGVQTMLARVGRNIDTLCNIYNGAYGAVLKQVELPGSPLKDRVLFSRYEDLVADPEGTNQRLSAFLGVAPGPIPTDGNWRTGGGGAARFAEHPKWRTYMTDLSDKAISASSVGNHRAVLNPAECARVDAACSGIRQRFGYR